MILNIVFKDGSSHVSNLPDTFAWSAKDYESKGCRRLSNIACLIHDFCHNKEGDYAELTANTGKVIYKVKL